MKYSLKPSTEHTNYLEVSLALEVHSNTLNLHLPAWRPGRYQMQNFAKNVRKFKVRNNKGTKLNWRKIKKDCWHIENGDDKIIHVSYEYYANQKDAGGSYFDANMVYINPINCCMYSMEAIDMPCSLDITFDKNDKIACGLSSKKEANLTRFNASNFHQLVDAPMMISNTLQHKSYASNDCEFHIWVQGKIEIEWDKVLKDFKNFTDAQIEVFGEFPEEDYHFMLWVPPHPYYHGVEHYNSTMMVLGPDSQQFKDMYIDLLGLSSHELFHTWNVKRIRPIELLPYRYNEENYFETCFVSEGLTTFYGDWILYRSGVFDRNQYHKELETTLKRHFDFAAESTLSLLESSYDLWLDGYEAGAPNRKVSVYHKGAIAALLLNDLLKETLDGEFPLDSILKELWVQYGKPYKGFTYDNYKKLVSTTGKDNFQDYFEEVIGGNQNLFTEVKNVLKKEGFDLRKNEEGKVFLEDLQKVQPKG